MTLQWWKFGHGGRLIREIFLEMMVVSALAPGNLLLHYNILYWSFLGGLQIYFLPSPSPKTVSLLRACLFSYLGVPRIYLVYLTPSGYSTNICWRNTSPTLSTEGNVKINMVYLLLSKELNNLVAMYLQCS